MAHQSAPPRGKSWSAGSNTGSFSSSSATRWMKSERLKKLEQDARTISSEMKILEADIRDLTITFEKLKRFDAKRVERLRELVDEEANDVKKENLDTQDGERGLNGGERKGLEEGEGTQGEIPTEGEVNEEVESLRSEHEAAHSQILYSKASLEEKRAELEVLAGKHQTLTDMIAKEEKLVQTADIDESLQQSAAVQQEMRSLSEDLGRLGRLMEGLKESNADPPKQSSTRPQQKPRMYHPVTQLRSRNLYRMSQNGGGASDLGRSASVGDAPMSTTRIKDQPSRSKDPSRGKEPAEFEGRQGGGNRKRQKSSSFELERGRVHGERAKLEVEAKEKRRLLESLASFSSQSPSSTGAPPTLGSCASSRDMSSPSSVFEGFAETPLGPATSGSTVLMSDSSESSEFYVEKPDLNSISSAAKRLDFESFAKEDVPSSGAVSPSPVDTARKPSYVEMVTRNRPDHNEELGTEKSGEQQELSSLEKGEDYLPPENGNDECQVAALNNTLAELLGTEGISPVRGIEAMQGLQDSSPKSGTEETPEHSKVGTVGMQGAEVLSPEGGTEEKQDSEVQIPGSGPEEIQDPVSEAANFEEEVLGEFSEGFSNDVRETDAEGNSEETLRESLPGVAKGEVEEVDIPTEEFDSFREELGAAKDEVEENDTPIEEFRSFREEPGAAKDEVEEIDIPTEEFESFREEPGTAKDEVEEIDIPTEEFESFREEEEDSREEDVFTTRNRVEEIDVSEEDFEYFEGAELVDVMSEQQTLKTETRIDEIEKPLGSEGEVSASDYGEDEVIEASPPSAAQAPELQENGLKSSEPGVSGLQSLPEAGQLEAEEVSNEHQNRRSVAENQMMQLSSQLSLLQKQVEEEVELHEKSKNDSQQEQTFAENEQLSRQVSFFADEVRGLRQNIDEIQHILNKEGELSGVQHWAKDLHSKCADQSAQLEHLGKQVSMLGKYLNHHLQLSVNIDDILDKEAQERYKVETQLTDLGRALAITVSTMEKEEVAIGEVIQHQKLLLVDQLKEAEKLRHIAEVRVLTLNNQIEQLEMVCDAAKGIQAVAKYQDKAFRYGLQTLIQMFLLVLGMISLYSRVAELSRGSLVPT